MEVNLTKALVREKSMRKCGSLSFDCFKNEMFCVCVYRDPICISLIFNLLKIHPCNEEEYSFQVKLDGFFLFWNDISAVRPAAMCIALGRAAHPFRQCCRTRAACRDLLLPRAMGTCCTPLRGTLRCFAPAD